MTNVRWENVPESEVRAEVEAVLESQGESKRIRQDLHKDPKVIEWRNEIQKICKSIVDEKGIDNITPDMIYEQIADMARENFPQSVADDIKSKLTAFLQSQFEDHI